jgi:hypothetical protein
VGKIRSGRNRDHCNLAHSSGGALPTASVEEVKNEQRFHQEYKQRRLEAKARGAQFMNFGEAERRLRKLIADSIADGGTIPRSFTEVFDR